MTSRETRTLRPGAARRPFVAMSRRQRIDCPHERRPGMAVCLHCLHNARVEARDRRRRAFGRFSAGTLRLCVVGFVVTAAVNAAMHPAETPAAPVATRHAPAKAAAAP